MEKTIVELFAGVGGFRLGFERASKQWKTLWFSQWEPGKTKQWAHDCYVSHFGKPETLADFTNTDISQVNKELIPDHNLLVGGFPCQDYSVAHGLSTEKGIQGKKGVLWWDIRDTLQAKNPKFVLLENVDRLLKSPSKQRGRDFGIMLSCFNSLGYSVEWRVINAAEYGAGQKRRRTFIFACKNETVFSKSNYSTKAERIIKEKGFFAKNFPIAESEKISSIEIPTNDLAELTDTFAFLFENAGFMTNSTISTMKVKAAIEPSIHLRSLLEENVPDEFFLEDSVLEKWRYLKGSKKIERTTEEGFTYTFSEGAIPFPDNLDCPARTMLTSEGTTNRSSHIIQDPQNDRFRILTPLEAERIQGFEDNWTNTGMPQKFRYFCMGNALVVPIITRMARTLNKIFDQEP